MWAEGFTFQSGHGRLSLPGSNSLRTALFCRTSLLPRIGIVRFPATKSLDTFEFTATPLAEPTVGHATGLGQERLTVREHHCYRQQRQRQGRHRPELGCLVA